MYLNFRALQKARIGGSVMYIYSCNIFQASEDNTCWYLLIYLLENRDCNVNDFVEENMINLSQIV